MRSDIWWDKIGNKTKKWWSSELGDVVGNGSENDVLIWGVGDFFTVYENLVGRMIMREGILWIWSGGYVGSSFFEDFVDIFPDGFEELRVCVEFRGIFLLHFHKSLILLVEWKIQQIFGWTEYHIWCVIVPIFQLCEYGQIIGCYNVVLFCLLWVSPGWADAIRRVMVDGAITYGRLVVVLLDIVQE